MQLHAALTVACFSAARRRAGVLLGGRGEAGLGHQAALGHPGQEGLLLGRGQSGRLGDADR